MQYHKFKTMRDCHEIDKKIKRFRRGDGICDNFGFNENNCSNKSEMECINENKKNPFEKGIIVIDRFENSIFTEKNDFCNEGENGFMHIENPIDANVIDTSNEMFMSPRNPFSDVVSNTPDNCYGYSILSILDEWEKKKEEFFSMYQQIMRGMHSLKNCFDSMENDISEQKKMNIENLFSVDFESTKENITKLYTQMFNYIVDQRDISQYLP